MKISMLFNYLLLILIILDIFLWIRCYKKLKEITRYFIEENQVIIKNICKIKKEVDEIKNSDGKRAIKELDLWHQKKWKQSINK